MHINKKKMWAVAALIFLLFTYCCSFAPVKAYSYTVYVDAYDTTESTNVSPTIYADGSSVGTAPVEVGYDSTVTVTADATDSYGNPFKGWLIGGNLYLAESLYLDPNANGGSFTAVYESDYVPPEGGGGTITPPSGGEEFPTPSGEGSYGNALGNYTLVGVNSEVTGLVVGDVWVRAFYNVAGRAPEVFYVNGTFGFYNYSTSAVPEYFEFYLADGVTRQYWLQPTESSGRIYILNSTLTTYTINFMDYTGILKNSPYILAQTYLNGSLVTVEKRKVDSQNTFQMALENGKKYLIKIEGATNFTYGDLLMTETTGVQLVIRGIEFTSQSILLYQYIRASAVRDFLTPTGAITISYQDTTNQTSSVEIKISYNSTVVFDEVFSGEGNQTFSYIWTEADNATDYTVWVNVNHQVYGYFYFNQYLKGEYTTSNGPLDLSFMGSLPINTACIIPALIIILVAACFSEATAEIGAFLICVVAALLALMGWIPIGSSALIIGFSLALLLGVVTVRRRFF